MRILITILVMTYGSSVFALDQLSAALKISAHGMKVQQERIKIIAQNIANKDSTASSPGGKPYRRQITILGNKSDKQIGANRPYIKKFSQDKSDFKKIYDPTHPAADEGGYVLYPNISINIENADSKDASRSYEANLSMVDLTKNMYNKTLDILK